MFPGIAGIAVGLGVFLALFVIAWSRLEDASYQFSKEFDKLLQIYLDITKFILTMAGGGIVLVVSATIFRSGDPPRPLPARYVSPLAVLVLTIFYGVLFMICEARDYEISKRSTDLYTRLSYARNQAFGYSTVVCFCLGYGWLVVAAVRG
jgi:Na+/H+-dicarboxylate symporter